MKLFTKNYFFLFYFSLLSFSVFSQQLKKPIKAPNVIYKQSLPIKVRDCWHNLDIEKDTLAGTSLIRAYEELLKNKKGKEIIVAVKSAVEWFEKVKIVGYAVKEIPAPQETSGKDRILVKDSNSVIWARFYTLDNNEPIFTGRDSKPKKTLAEIENERRVGYAYYGTWPAKLINEEYPKWAAKWKVK